ELSGVRPRQTAVGRLLQPDDVMGVVAAPEKCAVSNIDVAGWYRLCRNIVGGAEHLVEAWTRRNAAGGRSARLIYRDPGLVEEAAAAAVVDDSRPEVAGRHVGV